MTLPLILIGAVTRPQGLKGALRVVPYLMELEAYEGLGRVILQLEGQKQERAVKACRRHGRFVVMELEGVESRTEAEALAGAQIYVDRCQLRELGAEEYYKEDVIGAVVRTEEGRTLGEVAGFIDTGSNDVLVVRGTGEEHLIPLISSFVKAVDMEAKVITVVSPEDLYDEPSKSR
jgi:16S rRNA processing protein RimM